MSGNLSDYSAFTTPAANSGFDNKYDYVNSLLSQGAYYDPNQDFWSRVYYLPKGQSPGIALKDNNPDTQTFLSNLALPAAILGGGLALSDGGLLSSLFENAGGSAAGDAIGNSTLADLYGSATGTSAAAAPSAATGSSLYGAATSALPEAISAGGNGMNITDLFSGLGDTTSDLYNYVSSGLSGPTASGIPLDAASSMFGAMPNGMSLAEALGSEATAGALSGVGGSSVLDLIKQYGQPAAKALGLTNSDGSINWAKIASGGLSAAGGLLTGNAATDAAKTQSDAIIRAAQIAADAAKFKPVGVTTRFGGSQFGYDANGNLTSAGYSLAPDMKAQQDRMIAMSNPLLAQYEGAQAATAPMGQAAQSMMALGNNYLGTTPEQQAAKYMADQQALLAAPRETDMAALQARLQATGRGGLAIGGGASGALAANPELNAYYNSLRQQDLGLAAQATQGGMDYAKFGAGMVGAGGDMLGNMYGTQSAAYKPWQTAIGGGQYIEGLGQNAMDLGINIGAKGTAAAANSGQMMQQGLTQAAGVMAPANAYSPWGAMLSGAGNAVSQYGQPQQSYKFDPFTGRPL